MVTDPFRNPTVPIQEIQEEIYKYMLLYLILSLILFTIFWFHFPDNQYVEQPDLNESVKSDVIQILKSGNVIIVILVASLGSIPHIWGSTLLTVTLSRLEIYQNFVGAITTVSLISSTIFTFILTRLADLHFGQNQKNLIMGCMPVHALSMIGLAVCILIGTPQANNQCKYQTKNSRSFVYIQATQSHYLKSQILVQKFNFDKTPTFSRVFHPKNRQFSREIKVEFLDKK